MLVLILTILKTILYINITNIKYNKLLILLITSLVSMGIITLIEFTKAREKNKKIGQIIFYTSFSIIIFIDVMYYSYFQNLPSLRLLGQAGQLGAVKDIVLLILTMKNLLMIIDLPLVIYYIIKKKKYKNYGKNIKIKISSGIIGSLIILSLLSLQTNKITALKNQEFYSYHIKDLVETYFKDKTMDKEKLEEIVKLQEKTKESFELENKKHEGIGKDKNLIVIQVESLQNFVINLNYNNQEITPNLNKLIKDQSSIYFDEYFQLIGAGSTSDAEFVSHNSLHPSMEEYTYSQYADNKFYGLASLLEEEDYTSWVFHGYEKEFWNREKAYPNQGFQRFLSEEDYDFDEEDVIGFGISDEVFFDQSIDYIKELDSLDDNPFYAFLISLSCHTPYEMDEKHQVLDIKDEHKDNIVGHYLQAVHYTDREIGKFIDSLKKEGLYEDTVIAMYGDHFGITNAMEEVFDPMEDILGEPYNFDHIMNIPLIIHLAGEEINETNSKIGSQIDFYPTILNIMGYKNRKGIMMGQDLLNNDSYNFVPTQVIMRKGSFIDENVIFNISQDGIFENSRVIDRKTREELNVLDYRDKYEKAIREINLSDLILKEDIFKKAEKVEWDMAKINLESQSDEVPEQRRIALYNDFEIEDLDKAYSRRKKLIRVKVDKTTNLDKLKTWMEKNKEAYLILKTNEEVEFLEKIKDDYPELRDRYISEIDDTKKHFRLQRKGYENIILNITEQDYTDKEILDFLNMHKHYGVIMDKARSKSDLPKKLDELKVKTYVKDERRKEIRLHKSSIF